jgi:hypothetical protein
MSLSNFFSGSVIFFLIPYLFTLLLFSCIVDDFTVFGGDYDSFYFSSFSELYLDPYFPLTEAVA